MARPTIVGTPTFEPVANTTGTGASLVLTTPTGAAIGETLVAVLVCQNQSTADFTLPAGWSRFGLAHVDNVNVRVLGFYRHILVAAPAATYTFTNPQPVARRGGIMFRVQNANATQPIAQSAAYGTFASGTVTLAAITVPENNCLYLLANMAASIQTGNPATILTPPAGMTLIEGMVAGPGGSTRTALYAWQQNVDVGTSTAKTVTFTQTTTPQGTGSALILEGTDVDVFPAANAGPNQSVFADDLVTLTGTGSTDPDGTIVSYAWLQTGGTAVTLSSAAVASPTFTAPGAAGTLTFQLTVTDNDGLTDSDTMTVTVAASPAPTFVGIGAASTGATTSLLPVYPTGLAVDDLLILFVSTDSTATPTVPAGWTQISTTATGGGMSISTFRRTSTGAETGTVNVSGLTGNTKGAAWITAYRAAGSGSLAATYTTGTDTDATSTIIAASGTSWTAASSELFIAMAAATTTTTFGAGSSARNMASAGATLGTQSTRLVSRFNADTMFVEHRDAPVTAGGTGVPSYTATLVTGAATGKIGFLRLTETVNLPPVANAGPDQSVVVAQAVTLTGAASSDPDGTIASYLWSQTAGTAVTLSSATAASPTFTAPGAAGTLTFQLTVTDNLGATDTDTVTVTVSAPTAPTFVGIGATGTGVTTSLTATYPTGLAANDFLLLFVSTTSTVTPTVPVGWTQMGSTATGGGMSISTFRQTSDGTETGAFLVSGLTGSTKGAAWITAYRPAIAGHTLAPSYETGTDADTSSTIIAASGASWSAADGEMLIALVAAVTPTGTYAAGSSARNMANAGVTIGAQSTRLVSRYNSDTMFVEHRDAPVSAGGVGAPSYTATLNTVTAATAAGMIGFLRLTDATTQPPVANAGPDQSVAALASVTLTGAASTDPDGTIVSYAWTQLSGTTVTLAGTGAGRTFTAPSVAGGTTLVFQLLVTDDDTLTDTDTVTVNVAAPAANLPPVANAGPDQSVAAFTVVTLTGAASADPDGSIIAFAWVQTAGPTVVLSSPAGMLSTFTAPGVIGGTTLTFQLTATDDDGATGTDTVTVLVGAGGQFYWNGTAWKGSRVDAL